MIAPKELSPYYAEAENLLAVDHLPDAAAEFFTAIGSDPPNLLTVLEGIAPKLSKWTPFAKRNLAATLGHELLRHPKVQVFLHAQVTELLLAPGRTKLEAVLIRTLRGTEFRFEAEHFVLGAGTVETVRLMLASRSVVPEGVGNAYDQVGRNFHDHLTLPAAVLEGPVRTQFLRQMRPWIVNSDGVGRIVHSVKLEADARLRARLDLNAVLAHITLEESQGSGLAAVRAILLARQQDGVAHALLQHALQLPGAALEAIRLAWSAQVDGRRFVSASTRASLYINAAQDLPSASRITLSSDLDAYGEPLPVIDWRISAHELHTIRAFAAHLQEQLQAQGVGGISWQPELFRQDVPLLNLDDARHAMGGACMGSDPRTSVVNRQLRVHGVENLWIASAATFPTGDAHLPTLPLMALTLRLADQLSIALSA
jgi:choline dehydrogenase-like flavoprotein